MSIKQTILTDVAINSQDQAFKHISEEAVKQGYGNDQQMIYDALYERENQSTTGMMDGFAIPHCKTNAITEPSLIILKLDEGIEWDSMDGKPTSFIISLLIPDSEKGTTHLKVLSNVARLLMKDDVKTALKTSNSAEEIAAILDNHIY